MNTSDIGTSIWNAMSVVLDTYKNVSKLLPELDIVASEEGFVSITPNFLRWHSDREPNGWLYSSFIKLFQRNEDPAHAQVEDLRQGSIYVVDVNLFKVQEVNEGERDRQPLLYLCRFVYDPELSLWTRLPGMADHWRFYWPIRDPGSQTKCLGFYSVSVPAVSQKKGYWGLERALFTTSDLVSVNSRDAVKSRIFQPLKELPES